MDHAKCCELARGAAGRQPWRNSQNLEQIYYILSGEGKLVAEGQEAAIREGDAIHLLPETTYHISNTDESWLTYLIVAAG